MKVLIVDDNESVRQLLRDHLPANVDEVYECSDGIEAFAAFKKYRPDWVLMDQEMPQMNGLEAIQEIIGEFPEANICMVTAYNQDELRDEAIASGVRRFVVKENLFELESILGDQP